MNMRDRILKIMEREGLTPSKFAESIGIQRSAMSHIISGRNNPSLDVLLKYWNGSLMLILTGYCLAKAK
jgi:transcriptional regulator with XRE-family HTH domain